ncbi:MAG: hypothetical protein JOZ68_01210, partial [Acidimicrobiia bacterium]|nr:hypothetical protein [Acidimicrobiia bacterium]
MPADLLATPLDELLTQAAAVRDATTGRRVTYSPKSSWVPPAAVKISRSNSRRRSSSMPSRGSSGPASSAVPSTVSHSHPAR